MRNIEKQKMIYEDYAEKSEDYESFACLHYLSPNQHLALLESLNLKAHQKVLDIGCASGKLLDILSQRYHTEGVGIDITFPSLKKALINKNGNFSVLADAERLPLKDDYFDFVISFGTFEHLGNIEIAIAEANRVLRKGGKVLIWLAVKDHRFTLDWVSRLINPKRHRREMEKAGHSYERMLTKKEFVSVLKAAGMKVERLVCYDILLQPIYDYMIIPWVSRLLRKVHYFCSRKSQDDTVSGVRARDESSVFKKNRDSLHRFYRAILPFAKAISLIDRAGAKLNFGASFYIIASKPDDRP